MAEAIFECHGSVKPRRFAIGFDQKTWDITIYEDGSVVGQLPADQAGALRLEILKTAGFPQGKPGDPQ